MLKHISIFSVLGSLLAGCTVESATVEETAEAEQMLGDSCSAASPVAQGVGWLDHTTPQTYDPPDCFKGQVVDVIDLSPYYVGEGNIQSGGIYVTWADIGLGSKAACEASVVRALLFEKQGNGWNKIGDKTGPGRFHQGGGGWSSWCDPPWVRFTSEVKAGKTYRVAVTARNPSNATRMVNIRTEQVLD